MTNNLFIRTLNMDLQAVSAYEAMVHLLRYSDLKKILRYRWLQITHALPQGAEEIQKVLSETYYLMNPNKEVANFEKMPISLASDEAIFVLSVNEKEPVSQAELVKKILNKTGVNFTHIQTSTVWALVVKAGVSRETQAQDLLERVVVTSSGKAGILANPLYQNATWLDPHQYCELK